MKKLIVLLMSLVFAVACSSGNKEEVVEEKLSTEIQEREMNIEVKIEATDEDLNKIEIELNNLNK